MRAVTSAGAGLTMAISIVLLAWPLTAGMVVATDDVGMLLFAGDHPSFGALLERAWRGRLFRPLFQFGAQLLDPDTRSAWGVAWLHLPALWVAAAAVERLASKLFADPLPRWSATVLFLLHPSTTVCLWQADTLSQTTSAAAGLWLFALASGSWTPRRPTTAWLVVTALGLLTKETFLGWVAVALLVFATRRVRRLSAVTRSPWPRSSEAWLGPLLSAALVVTFVLARAAVLSTFAATSTRYSLHVDVQIVKNVATLGAGLVIVGPLHALMIAGPRELAFWVAVFGTVIHALVLALAVLRGPDRAATLWLWACALLTLAPVMPMGHVSELYLMGPNALCMLCLARASCGLFERAAPGLAWSVLACLLATGVFGVASRAYHVGLTWAYGRALTAQVERMAAADQGAPLPAPKEPCPARSSLQHSVYVAGPRSALNEPATAKYFAQRNRLLPTDWAAHLDCAGLPVRRPW